MNEARYLKRGALLFISAAFFALALAAVKLGSGNMVPGVEGNTFSLAVLAGLFGSAVVTIKKW